MRALGYYKPRRDGSPSRSADPACREQLVDADQQIRASRHRAERSVYSLAKITIIKSSLACALAATVLLLPALSASTLSPGQTLQVTFTSNTNNTNCSTKCTPDLLLLTFNDYLTFTGSPILVTQLLDGNTLLGTFLGGLLNNPYNSAFFYIAESKAPGVATDWFVHGVTTDLTTLGNGTINGILRVTVTGGTIGGLDLTAFTGSGSIVVEDGVGGDLNSFGPATPNVTQTLATITPSAPEPATFVMAVGGLLLIGPRLRCRRQNVKGSPEGADSKPKDGTHSLHLHSTV